MLLPGKFHSLLLQLLPSLLLLHCRDREIRTQSLLIILPPNKFQSLLLLLRQCRDKEITPQSHLSQWRAGRRL